MHSKSLLSKLTLVAAAVSATFVAPEVYSGVMHSDVSIQTYTDFGQNMGRYVVGGKVNALLEKIRTDAGGITIPYTDGQADRVVMSNKQGMINFSATIDNGAGVAISPTFIATVHHNPAYRINASYGNRVVGSDYSLKYEAIAIEGSDVFWLDVDGWDYAVHRQSKLQTDAVWNPVASQDTVSGIKDKVAKGETVHIYHSGGGVMEQYVDGSYNYLESGHIYNIGTVQKITGMSVNDEGVINLRQNPDYNAGNGANANNPLPNGLRQGDSGSPVFIYNATAGRYEYIASQQAIDSTTTTITQARGNVAWVEKTLASFNVAVDMATDTVTENTVYLNKITQTEEVITDSSNRSTTICEGTVTNAAGDALATFNGIASGQHTWKSLAPVMDSETWTWYTYSGYLNQTDEDLFFNDNLVFSAAANAVNNIILTDTVDLGVGYVEFNAGEYHISSELTSAGVSEGNLLNSAGYVLNAGAKVHIKLTNPSDYVYEWRAMGPGELYIDGTGNTHALLNVGGESTSIYNRPAVMLHTTCWLTPVLR